MNGSLQSRTRIKKVGTQSVTNRLKTQAFALQIFLLKGSQGTQETGNWDPGELAIQADEHCEACGELILLCVWPRLL